MSSSQPSLSSFNPHAVHPFTAGNPQPSGHHHSARTPNPSSHTSKPQNIPTYNSTPSSQQSMYASSITSTTVKSPQPRPAYKNLATSQPIFTPFRLERSSPELRDILVKKENASAWPVKSSSGTQGVNGGSNGKK